MDAARDAMVEFAPSAERQQRVRDYLRGKDKNGSGKVIQPFDNTRVTSNTATAPPVALDLRRQRAMRPPLLTYVHGLTLMHLERMCVPSCICCVVSTGTAERAYTPTASRVTCLVAHR